MAEPVALGIKPPTPISLGDMLNLARGAQAYQQEQQINPLTLERARAEAELATKTLQPKISQAVSQARTSEAGARESEIKLGGVKRQAALEAGASLFPHEAVIGASQLTENATPQERKKASDRLITAINKEFVPRLEAADLSPSEIEHQRIGLVRQAMEDPRGFQSHLQRGTALAGGAQVLAGQNLPQTAETSAGQVATKILGTGQIKPMQAGANINPTATDVELGKTYQQNLADRVVASNQFLQRAEEIKPLLNEFKPGAGTSTYAKIAEKLQALGAPQGLVDSVAKGDLSAVQSLNKFMAQSVMSTARQAASGKPYANEIDDFVKNNPTIETDPRALKRFIDFNKKLARTDLVENETLAQAKTQGIYNPGTWQADWQKIAQSKGLLPKTPSAQSKEPAKEPTKTQERTVVRQGTYNGRTVIEYSDGSVRYK